MSKQSDVHQYRGGPEVKYITNKNSDIAKRMLEQRKEREEMDQQRRSNRRSQLGNMVQVPQPGKRGLVKNTRPTSRINTAKPGQVSSSILTSILDKRQAINPPAQIQPMEIEIPKKPILPESEKGEHLAKWYGPWKNLNDEISIKYMIRDGIVIMEIPPIEPQEAEYSEHILSCQLPEKLWPRTTMLFRTIVRYGDNFKEGTIVIMRGGEIAISVGVNFEVFEIGQDAGHPYGTTISYFITKKEEHH